MSAKVSADHYGFIILCNGEVLLRNRHDAHSEWVFPRFVLPPKTNRLYHAACEFVTASGLTCTSMVPLPGVHQGHASRYVFCRIDAQNLDSFPRWPRFQVVKSDVDAIGNQKVTVVSIAEAQNLISMAADPADLERDRTALNLALIAATEPKPSPKSLGHVHSFRLIDPSEGTHSHWIDLTREEIQVPFPYRACPRSAFELVLELTEQASKYGLSLSCCYNCVCFSASGMSSEVGMGYCSAAEDPEFKMDDREHIFPRFISDGLDCCGRWEPAPSYD